VIGIKSTFSFPHNRLQSALLESGELGYLGDGVRHIFGETELGVEFVLVRLNHFYVVR